MEGNQWDPRDNVRVQYDGHGQFSERVSPYLVRIKPDDWWVEEEAPYQCVDSSTRVTSAFSSCNFEQSR